VPGVSHVRMGDRFKTTRRVEARGQLIGDALVLDKAVCAGRADGLFVEALGIEFAALNACNLAPTSAPRFAKFSGQFSAQTSSCPWCAVRASKCCCRWSAAAESQDAARDSAP